MRSKILLVRIFTLIIFIGLALSLVFVFYFIPQDQVSNILVPPIENLIAIPNQDQINLGSVVENTIASSTLPITTIASASPIKEIIRVGLPTHLRIPKINVDAAIEYVGLTPKGEVGIPKGPINVAWFSLGPRPGENGNAVIVGHYGWKDNIVAVFDNLYKLKSGDKVYVEDDRGVITTFLVRETRRYDPTADASYVFISNDENSHLNLITCEGVWNKAQQSYSKRLVVFADKVAE